MNTIPMVNSDTGKTADVHPDEVHNWARTGWRKVEAVSTPEITPAPEIPADWESRHWKQRVALARQIVGGDREITADDANGIIATEVATRDEV